MSSRTLTMRKGTLVRKLAEQSRAKKTGEYRRWIHTRDMPGSGIKTRLFCEKAAAGEVHLMSEAEHAVFLEAWWRSDVVAILDQYALDREKTQRAAAELNIDHPTFRRTGEPAVLSTDLVLFVRSGSSYYREVLSVKGAPPRGVRPLTRSQEIEQRTWENEGARYKAVAVNGMHANRSKNLAWIFRAANDMLGRNLSEAEATAQRALYQLVLRCQSMLVIDACRKVDQSLGLPAGSGARAFRQLAATKRIRFDLNTVDPLRIRLREVRATTIGISRRH
ncbi:Transposon Tn7 transposition protein TnsA [Burkholderia lata]|uniref:Transposon Tn7 transposition protein TnsA n=1 Tax=Burkholderia lata (strain ATCC 17760 / DSM 23089 / LMG 22485 / NCIMB 9086 / R18194 / 383) TaxID=482957 RepID=A0A6P2V3U0_BURL3|nr:TnsA endonuclease C-terminal domain-containing protein [Burkholderia lata]VWC75756.1 Transposon Tn7 transposition protein TnsA [Burkholderia lata]